MRHQHEASARSAGPIRGITVMELLVVIALITVLAAIALPSFITWRRSAVYRQTTRDIVMVLREAKSRAISTNREHRVELEPSKRMYRITQGNRASNSTEWGAVVPDWTVLPAEVVLNTNVLNIQMNTDGTANGGTISIQDISAVTMHEIKIARTGRIRTT